MCLDKVTRVIDEPTDEVAEGWKVFTRLNGNELHPMFYNSGLFVSAAWEIAQRKQISAGNIWAALDKGETKYQSGFHGFLTRGDSDAYMNTLRFLHYEMHRVDFRKIYTHGTQEDIPCIVADEMKVSQSCIDGTCDCGEVCGG